MNNNLRALRKARGILSADLAERAGVSLSQVNKMALTDNPRHWRGTEAVAEILGVDPQRIWPGYGRGPARRDRPKVSSVIPPDAEHNSVANMEIRFHTAEKPHKGTGWYVWRTCLCHKGERITRAYDSEWRAERALRVLGKGNA
jgi:lambda repressor-like predicted transcriptional regulator